MSDAPLLGVLTRNAGWNREQIERSFERDAELRAQRPVVPSTSRVPSRCATCRQWAARDALGLCLVCGAPFVAQPLVMSPVASVGELRHRGRAIPLP